MIEYELISYRPSGTDDYINRFSFDDLYKFLHLGYCYIKNREDGSYQVVKKFPKKFPDNNGHSYDWWNKNNFIFLSIDDMNKIVQLDYGESIRFQCKTDQIDFYIYKPVKHMCNYYTFDHIKLHDKDTYKDEFDTYTLDKKSD